MFRLSNLFKGEAEMSVSMADTSEFLQRALKRHSRLLEESFAPATFSLCGAARTLSVFISWLARYAAELPRVTVLPRGDGRQRASDIAYGLLSLVAFSSPIMPNLSQKLKGVIGPSLPSSWDLPKSIGCINLAGLPEDVQHLLS
jgi:hypothetical protein